MELKKIRYIHFTGIKGVAMTALALCSQDLGIKVTGSDVKELFVTDEILKKRNIVWQVGFKRRKWSEKPDLLITTGAHKGFKNEEVISANNAGIKVISQAEALNLFSKNKELISVCGVGGKTTISSMIATIFSLNNINVSYAIGVGKIFPIGYSGKCSKNSEIFICEADEYVVSPGFDERPKFSLLSPKVVVVTNIEHDHPDVYKTIKDTKNTYTNFLRSIPEDGLLIAFIDNQNTKEVVKKLSNVPLITFGFSKDADWRISNIKIENGSQKVIFLDPKNNEHSFELDLPGKYNALNALASFIVADHFKIKESEIVNSLEKFEGTQRRFEKIGKSKSGILVYDDYAHHPNEIKNVIKGVRDFFPKKRIVTVFQPHTYSRTKKLFKDFLKAFRDSDIVLILDIYSSAREKKDNSINSKMLVKEISRYQKNVFYIKNHKKAARWLKKNFLKDDLVITMGAGNVYYLDQEILKI